MITEIKGKCQFEDCDRDATAIAAGRETHYGTGGHLGVGLYCEAHAEIVEDERSPEYTVSCPNCGCGFGVN